MNILPHAAALISSLWMSVFSFQTLLNPYLGTAFIAVFFLVIVSLLRAIGADVEEFRNR